MVNEIEDTADTLVPQPRYEYRESLPPGARRVRGGYERDVTRTRGEEPHVQSYVVTRKVFMTQEEAARKRGDFYHPDYGWLIDGFKRETDATLQEKLADNSVSVTVQPE